MPSDLRFERKRSPEFRVGSHRLTVSQVGGEGYPAFIISNDREKRVRGLQRGRMIHRLDGWKTIPQGLKPGIYFAAVAARLKSCPVTKCWPQRVFPQPLKSCPVTKRGRTTTTAISESIVLPRLTIICKNLRGRRIPGKPNSLGTLQRLHRGSGPGLPARQCQIIHAR